MPATEKQLSRELTHPPEQVFSALVQVVEGGKYRLEDRDDDAHRASFEKGSKWGWIHKFETQVVGSDGASRLDVTVASPPDAMIGLANGLILQKAGEKLLTAVERELSGTA